MGELGYSSVRPGLWRYCLHGLALTIIMFGVIFGWTVMLAILTGLGGIIGLIIGFFVIMLLLGHVNKWIAENVWKISLEDDRKITLLHGLYLFLVLLMIGLPSLLASYFIPGLLTTLVLFVIYVPITGYIAKRIAYEYAVLPDKSGRKLITEM